MTYEASLQRLLADIVTVDSAWERPISGVSSDSRALKAGDLFLACKGQEFDARKFLDAALATGVAAIVCDLDETFSCMTSRDINGQKIPIFVVKNLFRYLGTIAARFYQHPSQKMTLIGITGTNGKTSCSHFVASCLDAAHKACGVIGTLGIGFIDHIQLGRYTTPDPINLQRELANLYQQGATAVAMEVTSHSLVQDRVQDVHFDIAVFTNLTRDHLDYHGTMENYARAKQILFEKPGLRAAVLNLDDPYGHHYLEKISHKKLEVYGYSIQGVKASIPMIHAENIQLSSHGFTADIKTPWGNGKLTSSLLGRFNISNLLATLTVLLLLEIPLETALFLLTQLKTVNGRMQVFGGNQKPLVVVDYAHTPDALMQALTALREHCEGKLWCVFGCGGERDRGKRPLMAQIAEEYSDNIIITDDNPRREDSAFIISEIVKGLKERDKSEIISDRRAAIAHAIAEAKIGDIILIAGKGHEPYQIIGTERLHFSDAEEVRKSLE